MGFIPGSPVGNTPPYPGVKTFMATPVKSPFRPGIYAGKPGLGNISPVGVPSTFGRRDVVDICLRRLGFIAGLIAIAGLNDEF